MMRLYNTGFTSLEGCCRCLLVAILILSAIFGLSPAFAQQDAAQPKPPDKTKQPQTLGDLSSGEKTPTKKTPAPQEIAKLIGQLGDEHFAVRERAQTQLTKLGFAAFDALSAAAEYHADIEVSLRAAYLVRRIRIVWSRAEDHRDVKRLLKHYESQNPTDRLETIFELSILPSEISIGPLCRLVRYEKSHLLSKWAAVMVIDRDIPEPAEFNNIAAIIGASLGSIDRPGAKLLRAYAMVSVDAKKSLNIWNQLVDNELVTLRKMPRETDRQLILTLLKRQFILLGHHNRRDDALAVARRMVKLQPPKTDSLREFVGWLTEQKAWPVIDDVADRFKKNFQRNAILLYSLAQARQAQGKPKLAKQSADAALALNPTSAQAHLITAYRLQEAGLFYWAEQEYLYVLEIGPKDRAGNRGQGEALKACIGSSRWLAMMYHDQQQEQKASNVLQDLIDLAKKDPHVLSVLTSRGGTLKTVKSRAYFYRACYFKQTGDTAREAEQLALAIAQDPTDADVLIAMHRLKGQTPEYRKETLKKIQNAAKTFEKQLVMAEEVDSDSQRAISCNQYAWLISNTEGDFDRALQLSKISNDIRTDSAGYLDTLGRCYYAVGDLDNAVRAQTKANRLEPHTGSIARQLTFFKAEAAKAIEKAQAVKKTGTDTSAKKPADDDVK